MIALHWVVITTGTRRRRPQDFAPRHLFTGADHRRRPGLQVKAGALTFGALEWDFAGVRQLPFQPEHSGNGMVTLG
jgi:hypothetical protein